VTRDVDKLLTAEKEQGEMGSEGSLCILGHDQGCISVVVGQALARTWLG